MLTNNFTYIVVLMAALGLGATGCDYNDGPVEEAGEELDQTVDKTGDKMDEAGEEIKETVE
ncbi:MAG: hypothetical protein IT488_04725 [Gammaproteobacteria bacterium]|nr:hypothetical protein [Gammaproteobacteria bacterium]